MTLAWMIHSEPRAQTCTPVCQPACAGCKHFRADARGIETRLPGMAALASGYASVRGDDGFCERHQRLLGAGSCCAGYTPHSP